jgi:tetrahydromethanopterin S-methyltransferase subunit G
VATAGSRFDNRPEIWPPFDNYADQLCLPETSRYARKTIAPGVTQLTQARAPRDHIRSVDAVQRRQRPGQSQMSEDVMVEMVNSKRSELTDERRDGSDIGILVGIAVVAIGLIVVTYALAVSPRVDPGQVLSIFAAP